MKCTSNFKIETLAITIRNFNPSTKQAESVHSISLISLHSSASPIMASDGITPLPPKWLEKPTEELSGVLYNHFSRPNILSRRVQRQGVELLLKAAVCLLCLYTSWKTSWKTRYGSCKPQHSCSHVAVAAIAARLILEKWGTEVVANPSEIIMVVPQEGYVLSRCWPAVSACRPDHLRAIGW